MLRSVLPFCIVLLMAGHPRLADADTKPEPTRTIDPGAAGIPYPESFRSDVHDEYFGTRVDDPYRWLESDIRTSDSVSNWVEEQNRVTFGYLETIPERERIRERLTELWDYERYTSPFKAGKRYYYYKNDGLQNQNVLYGMDSLNGESNLVLDPNSFSKDGTVSLSGAKFNEAGTLLAYGIREAGSDWTDWRIRDVATGQDLPDAIRWVKFSGVDWTLDGSGLFYSRYADDDSTGVYIRKNLGHKLYFHRVGSPQSQDRLVYERPDQPEYLVSGGVTEDGRYLVIYTSHAGPKNMVSLLDLGDPAAKPVPLIDTFEASYGIIGNDGPVFYVQTNLDAPNGRVVAIDTTHPAKENWKTVIPEAANVLKGVGLVDDKFIARYLRDASTYVRIFDLTGAHIRDVALPGIGTASGFSGKRSATETFYSFLSFTTPPSIYRYDMRTGESTVLRQAKVDFNPDDYTVTQVFYNSKDGTRVPMFLAHRKNLERNGNNPTLLYGYGGFNVTVEPTFSVSRVAWMEMGGVVAVPNLRGGGEYGENWHKAGTKLNKQNVFDDFIAAAEWLVENKYTRPEKLAMQGGSNGGLLVGAVMNQRPDLFGAALPAVGVMDMLRYHKFTIGRAWAYDYGTVADSAEFKALLAYSPYHNLKPGTNYPATLVTTADTDDRVVPGHSFKYAAALQRAQAGAAPVLVRIESSAGHGGGKPTTKIIGEVTDQWSFLVRHLGMTISQ